MGDLVVKGVKQYIPRIVVGGPLQFTNIIDANFEGANGATSFTEAGSGLAATFYGSTIISTDQAASGSSSLRLAPGAALVNNNGLGFPFLESMLIRNVAGDIVDFALEFDVRFNTVNTSGLFASFGQRLISLHAGLGDIWTLTWGQGATQLRFEGTSNTNSTSTVSRSWSPSTGVWYNVRVERAAGTLAMLVDDVQLGSTQSFTFPTRNTFNANARFVVGGSYNGGGGAHSWVPPVFIDNIKYITGTTSFS